ncbi:hypothetical protein FO519_009003 [Halicephalobus sp. NKZ332]|nr:hypothetical protein FO519_009003 [Halicephalobus sp. NKZ332]
MTSLLLLILFTKVISGYKILVFSPTNSVSHQISNDRIGDTLALDNHDVTILEAEFYAPTRPVKYAKKIVLGGFNASVFEAGRSSLSVGTFTNEDSIWNHMFYDITFFDTFTEQCDAMLTMHREKLEELSKENFDVLIAEQVDLCGIGLKHIMKIPTLIWVSSHPIDDHMAYILGIPTPLSYVPSVGSFGVSDKMSYFERVRNWLEFYKDIRSYDYGMAKTNEVFKKHYGPDFPDLIETARDADLVLVLVDEFLDFPRPILHNTVYIGGFGLSKSIIGSVTYVDELLKDKKGIVMFSLGTNMDTVNIPEEFKRNLFAAVSKFPEYRFVMKFDSNDQLAINLSKNYENIKVVDWVNQAALLSDSRVKLFMTHGGYNSLLESLTFATPVLVIPLFEDQYRNAKLAERNGFGCEFEKKTLLRTPSELIQLLKKMLETEKYNDGAARIQKLMKSKPLNSTERLWQYTRFLLDNGGKLPELQIEGKKLPLHVYFNLDIFIPIAVFSIVVPYLCILVIRRFVARQLKERRAL